MVAAACCVHMGLIDLQSTATFDLAGYTLMPGFFDMHTHITSIDNDGGDLSVLKETAAHGAIYATINARISRRKGVSTSRSVGTRPGCRLIAEGYCFTMMLMNPAALLRSWPPTGSSRP